MKGFRSGQHLNTIGFTMKSIFLQVFTMQKEKPKVGFGDPFGNMGDPESIVSDFFAVFGAIPQKHVFRSAPSRLQIHPEAPKCRFVRSVAAAGVAFLARRSQGPLRARAN